MLENALHWLNKNILHLTAGNFNGSARYEWALIRCQECDCVANFLRIGKSLQSNGCKHQILYFFGYILSHWRFNKSRDDCVNSNSKLGKFFGRDTSQWFNGSFRWRIVALTYVSKSSDNTRDVHNGTSELVIYHFLCCMLHYEIGSLCE